VDDAEHPEHDGEESADDQDTSHASSVDPPLMNGLGTTPAPSPETLPYSGRLTAASRLGAVKKLPPLLVYTVLRLLAFLVPLAIMWVFFPIFREFWWLAALFAALIGMSISLLFLRTPLSQTSREIYDRRQRRISDENVEDDAVE